MPVCLRARLIERLLDARVPEGHQQAMHLAAATGRAYQTTRRWIDGAAPGLPDLASFRELCAAMDGDPAWLLGFIDEKRSLTATVAEAAGAVQTVERSVEWTEYLAQQVRGQMLGCQARRMHGDEMSPEIDDGDTMFIDLDATEFLGNGNYLIAFEDHECVRRLEYRVGTGLVLICANPCFESTILRDAADTVRHRLKILGRVEGVVQVRRFWNEASGKARRQT